MSIDRWVADAAVTTQVGFVDDEVSALIGRAGRDIASRRGWCSLSNNARRE
ncbi:hypothetical protein [Gordonia oryzae]|uniref:hypothetical protein n=1 Tax=Gordonia oryzae TaxID=2487349 RepID=UPI001FE811D6|nr:hypothetical protein [Gordonia oryzae]